ncbi:GuaB3 family IMP dehydrogenase-related protein [Dehalococcoides mccartyi]|jgi:IMP dehydrogenase family protein|uniref:IMP dehydrogenase family protein n=1 Tax=Dehalococcoides mccartyi (strain CBDB1) TaxID=255470 RepID=A0A916KLT5_DEHMC|nr:GuaB3 family IMP dehydrogenase-related protein [Dehalococcoides mccartyi]AQU05478.1 guanosine monophosphate reductase [Dehalococcoides mccartyi]AQU06924.1 guanosine monophosphate reductase [Dehalococcoides mccartyi]AQX72832.1 guanosine monophosphate reductase [Dehalococcoides mccartyi]AQX74208.1 guanosine monophosphate reductase [Dehalococcoides mccartyi]AQY72784.1 guanosine monophosphate reductase [Dehalococcoides mccartyi]
MTVPEFKTLRRTYGFDEVAIVPGGLTVNPEQVEVDFKIGDINFSIPFIASAMDAVTNVDTAVAMSKMGGLSVLHLEGIYTRYENPQEILDQIISKPIDEVTSFMQKVYTAEPIKEHLISKRVSEIKAKGGICAVSLMPANAKKLAPIAVEAGADIISVASTVTSARHVSKSSHGLVFEEFVKMIKVPVLVGNCVSYQACLELMRTGVHGVIIGVGPGAACTSREVLGIGVPQITASMDCAAARETYYKETGRYVPIITDGGFKKGGDVCKAICAGADAVMLGSPFAKATEAPGRGYHWGMSHPHPSLPRGTRIKVGTTGSLEQILFGPTSVTDGTQNLVGALKTSMGVCGASNIREMQQVEMVIAPAITTEGKSYQLSKCQ